MNNDARRRLEDVLDREIDAARLLSEALSAERSALTGDSPDAVARQSQEKVQLLRTLEELEAQRREICVAADVKLEGNALASAESGIAAAVTERWRTLMQLMSGCRSANEVNGYIIHLRLGQIRQLIDIVRGKPAAMTYGPQGKTFAHALRALARA
jgi:flagella synthesis protein FlgN